MSNKKETPVSWLKHSIEDLIANDIGSQVKFKNKVIHALEMESKKQQKYDELLAMLERVVKHELTPIVMRNQTKELIEEAKKL
jgi:phosphoenolpyruvate carboxylase